MRIATADPRSKVIRISKTVMPPLFDQVLIHEAAHAIMEESGVTDLLSQLTDRQQQIMAEELLAWFLETYGIEVINAVNKSLGRYVCVNNMCLEAVK